MKCTGIEKGTNSQFGSMDSMLQNESKCDDVTSDVTSSPVPHRLKIQVFIWILIYHFLILAIFVLDLFLIKLQLVILLLFLSIDDFKLDYFNSLFLNLPANKLDRHELVLNSAARAVIKTSRFHHITPILKSIHELAQNFSTYTLQDSIYCL